MQTFRHMLLKIARERGVPYLYATAFALWGSKSKVPTTVYGNFDADDVDEGNRMLAGLPARRPGETFSRLSAPYTFLRTVSWEPSLAADGYLRLLEASKIQLYCSLGIEPKELVTEDGELKDRRLLMRTLVRARLELEDKQPVRPRGAAAFVDAMRPRAEGLLAAGAAAVAAASMMPALVFASGVRVDPLRLVLRGDQPRGGALSFACAAAAAAPLGAAALVGGAAVATTLAAGEYFSVTRSYARRVALFAPLVVILADYQGWVRAPLSVLALWLAAVLLLLLAPRARTPLLRFFYCAFTAPPLSASHCRCSAPPASAATAQRGRPRPVHPQLLHRPNPRRPHRAPARRAAAPVPRAASEAGAGGWPPLARTDVAAPPPPRPRPVPSARTAWRPFRAGPLRAAGHPHISV